jgi:hypothetical protein
MFCLIETSVVVDNYYVLTFHTANKAPSSHNDFLEPSVVVSFETLFLERMQLRCINSLKFQRKTSIDHIKPHIIRFRFLEPNVEQKETQSFGIQYGCMCRMNWVFFFAVARNI